MNILIVSPDFPYPPNHGGRADIWKRIQLLLEEGHTVDLLCTVNEDSAQAADVAFVKGILRDVFFVKRSYSWRLALQLKPFQALSRTALRQFCPRIDYDIVLLESEYVAEVLAAFEGHRAKKLLRVHNDESKYFKALFSAAREIKNKIYYYTEALKFRRYSSWVKCQCDGILHISHKEFVADCEGEFAAKARFFPPHVNSAKFKLPQSERGLRVLFVGNLFTDNNVAGLRWYLDAVHPLVLRKLPAYRLVIAGNSRGSAPTFLRSLDRSVTFYESPPSLDQLYESSAVFINPMRAGAGVKIKTINAIEHGLPVVSTAVGAEGIGLEHGKHFLCAESAADFAEAVVSTLIDDKQRMKLSRSAQAYLEHNFDNSRRLKELMHVIAREPV